MPTHSGHILVVDDDDSIREVATLALELVGGWRVSSAESGSLALVSARSEQPDVVLLDVMMPGMDGLATLAALRQDPVTAGIPVVLMTAKATTGDEPEWQGLDVIGVIAKPFDPMLLARRIRALMDGAESSRS